MAKSKNKARRYKNLINKIDNWQVYLWRKITGFKAHFDFKVKGFGTVRVPTHMLGPFRENFLDEIYLKNIPDKIFQNKPTPIIVDIGANVGYFSLSVFSRFPNAILYSFEPHPYCFNVLSDYKKTYTHLNFNVFEKAVSNTNESITLFVANDEFTTTSSVFEKANSETRKITVGAIKLDEFIHEKNLQEIDLLKLDCEGSEYAILYSLPKHVFTKIKSLSIETHHGKEANENLLSLENFIKDQGYKTVSLSEGYTGYIWAWKE